MAVERVDVQVRLYLYLERMPEITPLEINPPREKKPQTITPGDEPLRLMCIPRR